MPSLSEQSLVVDVLNDSTIHITWTQDGQVPFDHAEFYGYEVAYYHDGIPDFFAGPNITHNASVEVQNFLLTNLVPEKEYHLFVWPYRTMNGEMEYGKPTAMAVAHTLKSECLGYNVQCMYFSTTCRACS